MKNHSLITFSFALLIWCAGDNALAAIEYAAKGGRDPFEDVSSFTVAPSSDKSASPKVAYFLDGLVWNQKNPQAIVNGVVVRVGSSVGEAQVVDITRDSVKLMLNGEEILLKSQ